MFQISSKVSIVSSDPYVPMFTGSSVGKRLDWEQCADSTLTG